MTPEQAAHEIREAVVRIPGGFMTDAATYARGAELGFEGLDFYAAGRAGVLGDVHADIVVAALVFFAPALITEAWIDAAVRRGLPAPQAARLVGAALEGATALLRAQDMDTLAVRRAVTSPGGVTARGLAALEAGGVRAALDDAMDAVLEGGA